MTLELKKLLITSKITNHNNKTVMNEKIKNDSFDLNKNKDNTPITKQKNNELRER